jgi:adenine phosphoribosyltransferase
MADVITAQAQSIAAKEPATFWLGRHQVDQLAGRHVLIVDEVTSTGSTLRALRSLAEQAGAERVTMSVIATEGEPRDDVVSVVHLPVWTD